MKTKKMLIAFLLNLFFSLFEFLGGICSGSTAVLSDSVHDLGDSVSIGISYFLERASHKKPDKKYTYGYLRFSVLGSLITTAILIFGSLGVMLHSVKKIINPNEINVGGMLIFAVIGFAINFVSAILTHSGESLNEKAVNLHMLEDSLGWAAVLIGAIIIKFTELKIIDPLLSIGISVFIFINAIINLKKILNVFLEKTPVNINITHIENELLKIDGIENIHHIHIRSLDGLSHEATMHLVISGDAAEIKHKVRHILKEHSIIHSILETENENEKCEDFSCHISRSHNHHHAHHHHH